MGKKRVAVLLGGKSGEHKISLISGVNVIEALDKEKYEVIPIGIDEQGEWHLRDINAFVRSSNDPKTIHLYNSKGRVALVSSDKENLVHLTAGKLSLDVDVVFPVLHGPNGEDGTMQGLLELADIPYVGSGTLSSAICLDKDVMKRLFRDAGIPNSRFLMFYEGDPIDTGDLQYPLFVKSANAGSSVGVSRVKHPDELQAAVDEAFFYCNRLVIEEGVQGREIELSVLGNRDPIASLPGEIIPKDGFYSYAAKYLDPEAAALLAPAPLNQEEIAAAQKIAIEAYKVVLCEGMARVDLFLKPDGTYFVNEVNTIPGFTSISMYPKLWEKSGLPYPKLLDRLIELAIERHAKKKRTELLPL